MPLYIIREVAFEYNDFQYFADGVRDTVKYTFQDKEEAQKAYIALERKAYKEHSGFLYLVRTTEGEAPYDKVCYFLQQNFPEVGKLEFDWAYDLKKLIPARATDEQVAELLRLGGLRFYDLMEVPEKSIFFKIEPKENFSNWWDLDKRLYNSYQDAFTNALAPLIDNLFGNEDLLIDIENDTHAPILFRACLQNCQHIFFDETDSMLKIDEKTNWAWADSPQRPAVLEELRALLPFMKQQYFDIVEVDLYAQTHLKTDKI